MLQQLSLAESLPMSFLLSQYSSNLLPMLEALQLAVAIVSSVMDFSPTLCRRLEVRRRSSPTHALISMLLIATTLMPSIPLTFIFLSSSVHSYRGQSCAFIHQHVSFSILPLDIDRGVPCANHSNQCRKLCSSFFPSPFSIASTNRSNQCRKLYSNPLHRTKLHYTLFQGHINIKPDMLSATQLCRFKCSCDSIINHKRRNSKQGL